MIISSCRSRELGSRLLAAGHQVPLTSQHNVTAGPQQFQRVRTICSSHAGSSGARGCGWRCPTARAWCSAAHRSHCSRCCVHQGRLASTEALSNANAWHGSHNHRNGHARRFAAQAWHPGVTLPTADCELIAHCRLSTFTAALPSLFAMVKASTPAHLSSCYMMNIPSQSALHINPMVLQCSIHGYTQRSLCHSLLHSCIAVLA